MHAFRLLAALVTTLVVVMPVSLQAQAQTDGQWSEYDEVFENGASHANVWQWGWTGIYGTSLAVNAYQSSEASDPDDRFDARVGVVKSALAVAGMLTDRQPHPAALAEYERLKASGDLSGVQALGLQLAQAERERRGWGARVSSLVVNGVAGAVIAADGRESDGAINFATGMLVNELQIWSQPNQASSAINRFQPANLSLGPITIPGEYAFNVGPQQLGATWRY
ncbi:MULTISPECIES: hypothetical protein [Halomonadaceae]|uniref:Uncharacterized protein n=1 Tax=Vreelandella titanicae TaxID=664683 RepID=A0A558J3T1_9GAMM|nr:MULTISPECIES: hypothetical protein [Halomonas]TVU88222.1 hypothetical protein FQP89_18375 [Halomonas titanicae]CEP38019.1 Putative uncharacterized protein [Halomonas sp. R57-5]